MSVQTMINRAQRTPDYLELKKNEKHLVFVYGTLKKDKGNSRNLAGCEYLGTGRTVTGFTMYSPSFPVLMKPSAENLKHFASGEVYAVDADVILTKLDPLEANGYMYNRVRLPISMLEQEVKTKTGVYKPIVNCWAYLGVEDYWNRSKGSMKLAPTKLISGKLCYFWS